MLNEPVRDKTTKSNLRQAMTQSSMYVRPICRDHSPR